jgi:excisionase family DNA binding protein
MVGNERLLLRVKEVGDLTGIGRTNLYALIADGSLPSIKLGRSIRISRRALEEWIAKQEGGRVGENN